ncbi:hypothetical protein PMAYCL1PPCAC_13339, partial [Pristionchus mayeri]
TSLYLFNDMLIFTVLLNMLEHSPSTLRIPISAFSLVAMEAVKDVSKSSFGKIRDVYRMAFCSTALCILLAVGVWFREVLDEDSFSVFMNDLVKDMKTGKSLEVSPDPSETEKRAGTN